MKQSLCTLGMVTAKVGCTLLLGCLFTPVQPAQAQGKLQLSLAPMRMDLEHVKPGQNYTDATTLSNASEEAQRIVVWAADWRLNEQSLPVYLEAGSLPAYSCSGWLAANPTEFDLAPGKSQHVRYTLSVPPNAPEQGYHCALVFQTQPSPNGPGQINALRTQLRLVTTFYATVGSPIAQPGIETLTIVPQAKRPPAKDAADPGPGWNIELTLSNPGETHYRAQGIVKLLDATGRMLDTFTLESSPVLPKTQRRFSWTYQGALVPGEYHLQGNLDFGQKAVQNVDKAVTISEQVKEGPAGH